MKRTRHEISHKTAQDEMRRSHRRLWMHIAGVLTCGRLPKSQRAAVVRSAESTLVFSDSLSRHAEFLLMSETLTI